MYPTMNYRLQVINGYVSIPDGQIQLKTKLTPEQILTLIPGSQIIKVGVHGNDQQFVELPSIEFAAGEDWYAILRAAAED